MLRRRRAPRGRGARASPAASALHAARTMAPNGSSRMRGLVRAHLRGLAGELLGTALLVSLGVAACLPAAARAAPAPPPLAHAALAFGFVVLCNVEVFGPVSGAHMNPSVTLAALLTGRISPALAATYVLAQLLGATVGFGAVAALAPAGLAAAAPTMGVTLPARGVAPLAAAAVEALLTGLLALLCCALWAAPPPPDRTVPIKFGLTIAGLVFAGGELTGASLNPARSLAPALIMGVWRHHWVYWVGPLGGAALAALLHRLVLAPLAAAPAPPTPPPRPPPAAAPPDELPLNDKAVC